MNLLVGGSSPPPEAKLNRRRMKSFPIKAVFILDGVQVAEHPVVHFSDKNEHIDIIEPKEVWESLIKAGVPLDAEPTSVTVAKDLKLYVGESFYWWFKRFTKVRTINKFSVGKISFNEKKEEVSVILHAKIRDSVMELFPEKWQCTVYKYFWWWFVFENVWQFKHSKKELYTRVNSGAWRIIKLTHKEA